MADDDTDTGAEDQQTTGSSEDSKPGSKDGDGKSEGKGKDDKKSDEKKDDEQERKDRFAEAAGDPLAGTLGGPSAQAAESQAYRSWVRTVHAPGAAAFVGGGSIGVLNITTGSGAYDRRAQAPGPVRNEVITKLNSRYAPVVGYETFLQQLRSARLLVLRGAPGTGRTTTGLRLLAKLADNVARFSPDTDLRTLTAADLEPQTGYLLELIPGSGSPPPTPAQVDRLRDYLAECECYLVLIAPHDIRYRDGFDGYVADCPLPDPREVFDQAVEYEIRHRPNQAEVLRQVAIGARPNGSAGPQTPSEVQWLVAHLMSTAASDVPADLDLLHRNLAARYVSGWFEPLARLPATSAGDESVRLAAFRIALAVFNDGPFDLVAEAAEDLTNRILIARSPRRTPGRPVFARPRGDYVANSRASLVPGSIRIGNETASATFVRYDDDRLQLAVLRHVWATHNLRAPLLSWLESLSSQGRPFAYMRAALAIGLLTSWDFSYTYHKLIEPWARSSKRPRRRRTAAVALDEASRNDEVRPVVREILDGWGEKGTFAQRWTAAMALGYDLGLQDPAKALKVLRKLGCWEDGELVPTASWAVARVFVCGGIKPVIKALGDWLDDDRRDVRWLGIVAVWRIANMKVGELEDEFELTDTSAGGRWTLLANRRRWPLLVALADEDPALLDPLADLVWRLTRSALAEEDTAKTLKRWMRAGKKDPTCIGRVGRFLALLGDDHSDRARLLHLVHMLRRDPDDPLPAAIADRLERAIEYNIHISDEKGVSDDESSAQSALATGA
jgi:hypothetical protein